MMHIEIEFHAEFVYRREFVEDLGDILTLFDSDFAIEGYLFGEEIDSHDEEDKQDPSSDFRSFLLVFHIHGEKINVGSDDSDMRPYFKSENIQILLEKFYHSFMMASPEFFFGKIFTYIIV